jgi:CheY-like chemotaxis protein
LNSPDPPTFHVLIVDRSEESREVFRTVLGQRGWSIVEASGHDDGLKMVQRCRPHVIVLDVDGRPDDDPARTCDDFRRASEAQRATLLVLGAQRQHSAGLTDEQIVRKPYHYAPLIRKIEQLCRQSLEAERQG